MAANKCPVDLTHCSESNTDCVWKGFLCDGYFDCTGGGDEDNCDDDFLCGIKEHKCKSGECIGDWQRCDLLVHCSDSSDETECDDSQSMCTLDKFFCHNAECVDYSKKCDFVTHCTDGSDEHGCVCPEVPTNGTIDVTYEGPVYDLCSIVPGHNLLGCQVMLSCKPGFTGTAVVAKCGGIKHGEWDVSPPYCAKDCPKFGSWLTITPTSGCSLQEYNKEDCTIDYHCATEYLPNHGSTTCGRDIPGIWSKMPVCVRKGCEKFDEGVVITSSTGPLCNNSAYYLPSCKTSFECGRAYSGGRGVAVCGLLAAGKWSANPVCVRSGSGKSPYTVSKNNVCIWICVTALVKMW